MTQRELVKFAAFINQPVDVARQIIEQEEREIDPDFHDGYNYRTQRWVLSNDRAGSTPA